MPLPFDFEGKGVLGLVSDSSFPSSSSSSPFSNPLLQYKWNNKSGIFAGGSTEPTSVLETIGSPSPPSSTLSSSLSGGGGGSGVAAISGNPSQEWAPKHLNVGFDSGGMGLEPGRPGLEIGSSGAEKCGLGMEDWENVMSESSVGHQQDPSMARWIMGDLEDPSMGLNKLLQTGGVNGSLAFEFNGGSGVVDQGFGNLMDMNPNFLSSGLSLATNIEKIDLISNPSFPNPNPNPNPQNPIFSPLSPSQFNHSQQETPFQCSDAKPSILNPQFLINQHQSHHSQNPSFFMPLSHTQQEHHHLVLPPPAKRPNVGNLAPQFGDLGQNQGISLSHQLQLLSHYPPPQQRPDMEMNPRMAENQTGHHHHLQQQQETVMDQLYKAAELVQTGNPILAQPILARLNHQLSPIGKPFHRAAFYCKEALQLLLNPTDVLPDSPHSSPFSLIYRIGAYKTFSEISPFLQFANFTCNQAILEVVEGHSRIHIVDFDIGYGGQWASLMQELALRSGGSPSLKITAFASPSSHDQIELGLTRENLIQFAREINVDFQFEFVSLDSLSSGSWCPPLRVSENEAIAVNLPANSLSNHQLSLPLVLRFVKQLSPKIVVSVNRGCDRADLPFPNHVIHVLQWYSHLLESLDAVNVNLDALQKIEKFLFQPGYEKIVMDRCRSPEKTAHWRTLFLSAGFTPLTFSNFAESQAECLIKRTPVRGFHVEKRQSSLVLCWQRKDLVSASAWRC